MNNTENYRRGFNLKTRYEVVQSYISNGDTKCVTRLETNSRDEALKYCIDATHSMRVFDTQIDPRGLRTMILDNEKPPKDFDESKKQSKKLQLELGIEFDKFKVKLVDYRIVSHHIDSGLMTKVNIGIDTVVYYYTDHDAGWFLVLDKSTNSCIKVMDNY